MSGFRAILISKEGEKGQKAELTELSDGDLMDGDVTVQVSHSTLNYKDGLAVTGKAPIVRRWPLIPGIDFAGVVEASDNTDFKPGDRVILNGWGVGETHHGGYAQKARVKGDWLIHCPDSLTNAEAMSIGTAGYTAALCVQAILDKGVTPDAGPVIVTGSAGGVGSTAIVLLSKLGFHVIASTGRTSETGYLTSLGAAEIIDRAELSEPGRPMGKERWAAGVDSVGSHTLANLLAQTKYGGCIAACGLAQGMDLPASVAPFILRGVSLLGIDSVMAPKERRVRAYDLLTTHLDKQALATITTTIKLDGVLSAGADIVAGKVRGRIVIDVN